MTDQATRDLLSKHSLSSLTSRRGKGRLALVELQDVTEHLIAIAIADDCDLDMRFKAFECYFERDRATGEKGQIPAGFDDAVVDVYVQVIADGSYANRWGLPYTVTSSASSRRLIDRGQVAAHRLGELLDNDDLIPYEGSEEATIANMHKLRYKDLAAALIAAILSESFPEEPDPAKRDKTIEALRARLD